MESSHHSGRAFSGPDWTISESETFAIPLQSNHKMMASGSVLPVPAYKVRTVVGAEASYDFMIAELSLQP